MSEPTKPTTLVAPDGQRYDVPTADGVAKLKAKGFRELNEAEHKDAENQAKYGEGILPAVGAAASGAASALTFGGSDIALAHTPLAEANREVVARNPTAHTIGQVAGVLTPMAAPLIGARAAKAATLGLTGAGKVAGALGEGAEVAAKAAGFAKAAPIVKGAVTGATEGAAFQVGSNVGQAARRDVDFDAETILAHTGEAAFLGAGIGAALPAAVTGARWTAQKAVAGLEKGVQGLRALGFGTAQLGVDAVEAGAGVVARNADAISEGVAGAARGAAGVVNKGAEAIAGQAENIGAAVEGAGQKVAGAVDEHLLPKIRQGLAEQTGRPDVINEVFANTPEAQALRSKLGSETLTGVREVHAEKLGKSLNEIWGQTLKNEPLFDELSLAVKREQQSAELAGSTMSRETQTALAQKIAEEARATFDTLGKYNGQAQTFFKDAIDEFSGALKNPTPESIYRGLDTLKSATDKISSWAKGAMGDTAIGAQAAANTAREFRTFAKNLLEDTNTWGAAGQIQQEVNAAYSRYRKAFDAFEKQFSAAKARGQPMRVLDGAKIKKWAKDITGQPGEVRNAVVDDLVSAQTDLINLTERLAKRGTGEARAAVGTTPITGAEAAAKPAVDRATLADVLNRSRGAAEDLSGAKTAAARDIDRAEVLQQTQNAILSRQGAGVNPLPVDLMQQIGGGALVGGAIGGVPGAVLGGGVTSVLQKYGALTTNPKTAIEFLNTIDRIRKADGARVADWIKRTLESGGSGATKLAERVDAKAVGAAVKRGAEAVEAAAPKMRGAIASADRSVAQKLLSARDAAERGVNTTAERMEAAMPGIMRKLLPAASYADVTNSSPAEWWARTQRTLLRAQANTQDMNAQIEHELSGLSDNAPELAQAIARQKLTIIGYLADRMPRSPRPYSLGQREWTPDPMQEKAFRDLTLVATRPDALLPLVTMGTATHAQVDAVKTLWPRRFAEIKQQIVTAVTDAASEGKPVPYESRLRLGQLLGVPLDPSQEPGFARWINAPAQGAQPAQPPGGGGQPQGINLQIKTDTDLPLSAKIANRQ